MVAHLLDTQGVTCSNHVPPSLKKRDLLQAPFFVENLSSPNSKLFFHRVYFNIMKVICFSSKPSSSVYTKSVTFSGNRNLAGYKNLMHQLKQVYPDLSLNTLVAKAIEDNNNFLAFGRVNSVYKIPGIDDFVIRIEKQKLSNPNKLFNQIFKPVEDISQVYNFGFPAAKADEGLTICTRVLGESHLGPNLIPEIDKMISTGQPISKDYAEYVMQEIVEISNYPLSSYIDLANKIKFLNEATNLKVDIRNPNNIMLDKSKKEFNIIDCWTEDMRLDRPYNGADDIHLPLLDHLRHFKYYDVLSDKDRELFLTASVEVIKKSKAAAKIAGLTNSKENNLRALHAQARIHSSSPNIEDYLKFQEFYKDFL